MRVVHSTAAAAAFSHLTLRGEINRRFNVGGYRGNLGGFPSPTHVRFLRVEEKTGLDLTQTDSGGREGAEYS